MNNNGSTSSSADLSDRDPRPGASGVWHTIAALAPRASLDAAPRLAWWWGEVSPEAEEAFRCGLVFERAAALGSGPLGLPEHCGR